MSAPVAASAPETAMPMPIHTIRDGRRPWPRAISPCQTGCVAPSATASATCVSFALGTQVPKWNASATPASAQLIRIGHPERRNSARNSVRRRVPATGASRTVDSALRQNAMASAGAAAYAMIGADEEIMTTASDNARTVVRWTGVRSGTVANPDRRGWRPHKALSVH
jgi:hypothetical protein